MGPTLSMCSLWSLSSEYILLLCGQFWTCSKDTHLIQRTLFHQLFLFIKTEGFSHHFAGVCLGVTQGDVTVQVDLVVVPYELEDGDVEATGEGHAVLCHADGVVLNVWTPTQRHILKEQTVVLGNC